MPFSLFRTLILLHIVTVYVSFGNIFRINPLKWRRTNKNEMQLVCRTSTSQWSLWTLRLILTNRNAVCPSTLCLGGDTIWTDKKINNNPKLLTWATVFLSLRVGNCFCLLTLQLFQETLTMPGRKTTWRRSQSVWKLHTDTHSHTLLGKLLICPPVWHQFTFNKQKLNTGSLKLHTV